MHHNYAIYSLYSFICFGVRTNKKLLALASVVQLNVIHPMHQEVSGSIPGQGACVVCELVSSRGHAEGRQPTFLSLSFLPPSSL